MFSFNIRMAHDSLIDMVGCMVLSKIESGTVGDQKAPTSLIS